LQRLPRGVGGAFRRTRGAIVAATLLLVGGTLLGVIAERTGLIPTEPVTALIQAQAATGHELVTGTPQGFFFIFFHNLGAGLVMAILAPFTLGVAGGVITIANGAVLGFLGSYFAGISKAGFFACGVAPHGVIELPALVLASAFALRIGASMVRPSPEGWLAGMRLAIADYGRGMLVVVPMFLLAALVETFLTPDLLRSC
jgi:stage II sporulation protein M